MSDEELTEDKVEDADAASETPADGAAAPPEEDKTETPKTLLSGDEGDGATEGGEDLAWSPPEGIELNSDQQAQLDQFTEVAREMGLSNDQFNKLIELDIQRGAEGLQQLTTAFNDRINSWAQATQNDQELGGESMPENLSIAKSAMQAVGTPELAKVLAAPTADNPEGLGLGNHPEVIRLFYRIGKAMNERGFVFGGDSPSDNDTLKRMYPTMFERAAS